MTARPQAALHLNADEKKSKLRFKNAVCAWLPHAGRMGTTGGHLAFVAA